MSVVGLHAVVLVVAMQLVVAARGPICSVQNAIGVGTVATWDQVSVIPQVSNSSGTAVSENLLWVGPRP